jgi:hypothetical protein
MTQLAIDKQNETESHAKQHIRAPEDTLIEKSGT